MRPPSFKKKRASQLNDAQKKELLLKARSSRFSRPRTKTMEILEEKTSAAYDGYIRVYIPGPIPGTEASVVIGINDGIVTTRDLFPQLNRRRPSSRFTSEYFDFYYRQNSSKYGAISNATKVGDLLQKELVILPKKLSPEVNEQEAYQFDLVRLANEYKSYQAWKVAKFRSGSRRKKFLLEIDRDHFTKTSLETGTLSHGGGIKKPVPIKDIKSVQKAD